MSLVLHALRRRTVDEVAAMFPSSARVLMAHGLDDERDRRLSLEQAAARRELAVIDILRDISPHVSYASDA
jgi:hypothetical protein